MISGAGRFLTICSVLLLAGISCRHLEQKNVIARVGKEILTLEDAQVQMGSTGQPSGDDLRRFVTHWVNEELLYQEAQRRGLDGTESFAQLLQETRRNLLAQTFLNSQFSDTAGISDSTLRQYYENHSEEFIVRDNMVKLNALRFLTREKASHFASLVTRGMPWNDASAQAMRDSTDPASAISGVSGQFVSQHSLFPPELWKVASSLGLNEISFPVSTVAGYCVIQPVARVSSGGRAGFEIAMDEVRARVRIEQQRRQYDDLLGTLRKRYSVEVVLPNEQKPDTLHESHD